MLFVLNDKGVPSVAKHVRVMFEDAHEEGGREHAERD
jgi:hypothetical protein